MKPKVLLIDDDFFQIRITSRYFQKTGWTVLTAGNGEDGLKAALTDRPELVIVDYSMPLMNGYDFIIKLHSAPEARDIPVLMLSGCEPAPEIQKLTKSDSAFLGFLAKPASFIDIEKHILFSRSYKNATR
ncbi:MAG TPA: hypothetical protein DDW67_09185 [Elusimicrobia bacterium]|nr:hypothetical protein [Elusimicrobiota bacterium]